MKKPTPSKGKEKKIQTRMELQEKFFQQFLYHKSKRKEKLMSKIEIRNMLKSWHATDIVQAGYLWNYVEKKDQGFLRGWRYGIYSIIQKLEENI